jgi:hypothetical protein
MENDDFELAIKIFNRINCYLKNNNATIMFKIKNKMIYYLYRAHMKNFIPWNSTVTFPSLNKECEFFLLGSQGKIQPEINLFIIYPSFFELHKYSRDPIINHLCNFIGNPTCLEEIILKMDLMGI